MIFSAGVHIIHASYPHHLSNFMAHDVIQSCFHIHRKYYILTDIYYIKYKVLIAGVKILLHNTYKLCSFWPFHLLLTLARKN